MHTKHYLTTILIILASCLSSFSVHAQNSSDTIRIIKTGLNYSYYKENTKLSFNQVMQLTKSNIKAYKLIEQSNNMRVGSYIFAIAGGGCLGYSLGYALGAAMFGNTINRPVFFSLLGVGAVFIGVGIGFEVGANNKAREGVAIFNNDIKQKHNANFDLGFSPGGVMLRLNF